MQAIVFSEYGPPDVLRLEEVAKPEPRDDEVSIQVRAASVNDWDWGLLRGTPFVNRLAFGLRRPKIRILGCDVAGRVESIGRNVKDLEPGDEVFGDLSDCGFGGFAEYVCAPERALARKPAGMTFEQAAAIPQAAMLAIQGLRAGRIQSGQKILLNGAGGGVGTFALQIARLYQAEVTAVDASSKLEMLRSMGAHRVIDYAREDFTRGAERYDLILDVKTNRPISHYLCVLRPGGAYVTVGGSMARLLQAFLLGPWISRVRRKNVRVVALAPNRDLDYVIELFQSGKLVPVIDRIVPLPEVPEALRHFGRAEHRGKVIVALQQPASS